LSNKVFAYDPDSQTWDEVAPYPGPAVDHAGAAVVNGIIYLIGGLTGWPDAAVNTVYAYDPATDSWSQRANLPRDRGAMGVAVLGGKIYAAGGLVDGGTAVTDLAVYDPQTNIWTPLAPMPTARDHLTMEAVNGMLYALGGRPVTINAPVAANEAYDPNTNTWQARAPLPVARGGHGSAVLDGKIIVFGGEGNVGVPSGMFANTDEYDPISNSWRALAPMITPRHGMDGAVLEGVVYVPGGGVSQGGSQSTTHEAFSMLTQQSTLIQTTLTLVFLIALMLWLRWIGRRTEER
jgi:N-acetylneuraminic acid mutarotase